MKLRKSYSGILFLVAIWLGISNVDAQSWQRVQGIDSLLSIRSLLSHNGMHFAAGDSLVYRSADGLSWQQTPTQPVPGSMLYGLLASHSTGLYLGTEADGVRRTTNNGATWTVAAPGLPIEDVLGIAVLGDSLFVGLGFSGVYVLNLTNLAAWSPCNTGLNQFGANSLSVVGDRLYAGLGYGFFVRARGAAQWTAIDLGIQRQVYEVVGVGTARFAATDYGVYRTASDTSAWRDGDIAGMSRQYIAALATQGSRLVAGLNYRGQHWLWSTDNGGDSWDVRAHEFAEIWDMRIVGNRMWAARQDGLWYYDLEPVSIRRAGRTEEKFPENFSETGRLPFKGRALDGRRVKSLRAKD